MGASYSVKHDNGGRPSKRLEHVDNLGSIPCLRAAANCVAQTMLLVCPQEPVRVLGGRVRVRTDNLSEIVNSGGYVRRGASAAVGPKWPSPVWMTQGAWRPSQMGIIPQPC